jgi:putative transposase
MSRPPRIIIPNIPYHVTQRGNLDRDVFYRPDDRKIYLERLACYSRSFRFDIQAYCLMNNHIHVIGIPRFEDSISRTVQVIQAIHTKHINKCHGWSGNLWQQHHSALPMDISHFWNALRYVEQNPVRAGILEICEDYPYSSAAFHCGLRDDNILNPDKNYTEMFDDWREQVNQLLDNETLEYLRLRTSKGLPYGDKKFLDKISRKRKQYLSKKKGGGVLKSP